MCGALAGSSRVWVAECSCRLLRLAAYPLIVSARWILIQRRRLSTLSERHCAATSSLRGAAKLRRGLQESSRTHLILRSIGFQNRSGGPPSHYLFLEEARFG